MAGLTKENPPNGSFDQFVDARLRLSLEHETLLFYAYALFLTVLLLSNYAQFIAHYLVLWPFLLLIIVESLLIQVSSSPPALKFFITFSAERIMQITEIVFSIIFLAAALYLLMLLLSSVVQPVYHLPKIKQQLHFTIEVIFFVTVTALLFGSRKDVVRSFFSVICVVAALSALIEIVVLLTREPVPADLANYRLGFRLRPGGDFVPRGELGPTQLSLMYAIFLVPCIAIISRSHKSFFDRMVLPASALILLCAVLLSQSRGTYLAVLSGVVTIFYWYSRPLRLFLVMTLFTLGVIFAAVPDVRDAMLWRGNSYRIEVWDHYVGTAWIRPWLGYGGLAKISFEAVDGYPISHPHNLVLSAQVRGGIFAAGAMIVMLLGGLYYAARYARLTGEAAPLGMITTLTVAGMFDYQLLAADPNWQWVCFWFPIGICVGTELYVRKNTAFSPVEGQRMAHDRPLKP